MCEFVRALYVNLYVNFGPMKIFSSCLYNSCIFSIFRIHLQFFKCNHDFCRATILLPIFDNFQYSLAWNLTILVYLF